VPDNFIRDLALDLGAGVLLLIIFITLIKMGSEALHVLRPRWLEVPKKTRGSFVEFIVLFVMYLISIACFLSGALLKPEWMTWVQIGVLVETVIAAGIIYRSHYLSASWTVIRMIIKPFKAEPPKPEQTDASIPQITHTRR